ncbi:hypothetical protein EVAR_4786_1 [Eumeta japonica]|uniref:Uncharacterized protein n=1 Tax=Eumeta variegata TaxID=151549 RepID=A0A4C1T1T2_EUMVA|nr:hypothetical protein EVAR_4786_1 [Eumeta japonica]
MKVPELIGAGRGDGGGRARGEGRSCRVGDVGNVNSEAVHLDRAAAERLKPLSYLIRNSARIDSPPPASIIQGARGGLRARSRRAIVSRTADDTLLTSSSLRI